MSQVYYQAADGSFKPWLSVTGQAPVATGYNQSDKTTAFNASLPRSTATQVTNLTEVLITASPCIVLAVHANDGSTGHCDLRNASAISGGSTPKFDVNATAYALTPLYGAIFSNGLTAQCTIATSDVTIMWAPYNAT